MSAFVCDKEHIRFLVSAAVRLGRVTHCGFQWYHNGHWKSLPEWDNKKLGEVGQMLWYANLASVAHRYPDCDLSELPGAIVHYPFSYGDDQPWTGPIEPVQVLKAIDCYAYQSSEHPGWEKSEAKAFCDALQRLAIMALPGYEEAVWGAPK